MSPNRAEDNKWKIDTILVVEDDEGLSRLITNRLEQEGFKTLSAFTGREALSRAAANQDLIMLLDFKLPDMDGVEILEKLEKSGRTLPFVIVTGYGNEELAVELMKKGAIEYVVKTEEFINLIPAKIKRACESVEQQRKLAASEEALRASEELHRKLFDISPDEVTVTDLEGRIRKISQMTLNLHGYRSAREIIGLNALDLIAPEDHEKAKLNLKRTLEQGFGNYAEYVFLRKDGSRFTGELNSSLLKDKDGNPAGFVAITRDITERKKTEEKINHLNLVLRSIHAINQLITRTKSRDYIIRKSCDILVEPRGYFNAWIALTDEHGKYLTSAQAGLDIDFTAMIKRMKEGKWTTCAKKAFRKNGIVITKDPAEKCPDCPLSAKYGGRGAYTIRLARNKEIYGILSVFVPGSVLTVKDEQRLFNEVSKDISYALHNIAVENKRQLTEKALTWERYLLRTHMDQTPDHIYFKDTKGRFIRISSSMARWLGLDESSKAIGKTDFDFFSKDHAEQAWNDEQEVMRTGKPLNKVEKETWADHPDIWVSTTKMPLRDKKGDIIGTFGISRNITDLIKAEEELKKKNEEYMAINEELNESLDRIREINTQLIKSKEKAEESDRLKSTFLANISHEIRTPMNGIMGFANLLLQPGLAGEKKQQFVSLIEESSKRMLNTINAIISISTIEAEQVEVSLSDVNIKKETEYLYALFKPEAEKKGLQLKLEFQLPDQDTSIKTDQNKVSVILTNLLQNAIKYTDKGVIEFGCMKKDNEIEFFVGDTGIGIDKDQREKIFDRFVQSFDRKYSRAYEGSGLGLSISKAYVELLGGRIWVESEKNRWSCFYFTIPFHGKPPHDDGPEKSGKKTASSGKLKEQTVMIVEDEESASIYLNELLKDRCKKITYAGNGKQAVELLKKNPDTGLILMDLKMPVMDGYAATKKIRGFNKDVIIIAQTAYAMEGDREKAIQAGCNDYISKPIDPDELYELIFRHF